MQADDDLAGCAERLWAAIAPRLPGFTVEVLAEVDSTNTELMRRARAGQVEPVLLVARHQTAGRGRLGRGWASAPGDSLTFSLGLPLAPASWSGLSLAVGVAVAEALDAPATPRLRLKWPNDVWLDDRKLAGILIETAGTAPSAQGQQDEPSSRLAVVGIGINLATPPAQGLSTPPAGLRELWPDATPAAVLERVGVPVVDAVLQFAATGFAPFHARFLARDLLRGRAVTLSDGAEGFAEGVDEQGALRVRTAAGLRAVHSAEVSVRPAAGGASA